MEALRNQSGLYTFKLRVQFKSNFKTLTGLVDTGSNICLCSYQLPVTLRARPTTFEMITVPATGKQIPSPGYSLFIRFDSHALMTHVFRLPLKMEGIDFILGMSILEHCSFSKDDDKMIIKWRESQ